MKRQARLLAAAAPHLLTDATSSPPTHLSASSSNHFFSLLHITCACFEASYESSGHPNGSSSPSCLSSSSLHDATRCSGVARRPCAPRFPPAVIRGVLLLAPVQACCVLAREPKCSDRQSAPATTSCLMAPMQVSYVTASACASPTARFCFCSCLWPRELCLRNDLRARELFLSACSQKSRRR
jgi:hypothetical protein